MEHLRQHSRRTCSTERICVPSALLLISPGGAVDPPLFACISVHPRLVRIGIDLVCIVETVRGQRQHAGKCSGAHGNHHE